jgi:hypothetical protein
MENLNERVEEKVNETINYLEDIKKEINELQQIIELLYKKAVTYIFDIMSNIAPRSYAHNSIIFIDNNTVKYIARDPEKSGFSNFLVSGNFVYEWSDYVIKNKTIIIDNYTKYIIPKEIIDKLKMLPESPMENIDPILLKLYYFLKQGYKIVITESKN